MACGEEGWREDIGVISRHRVDEVEQRTLTVMKTLPVSRDEGSREREKEREREREIIV